MPLEIDFLRYFDWNPLWINRLQDTVGSHLLPIQEKAIRLHGLLHGRNLLAAGPTSCGKGLLGELACLSRIRSNKPGLMVVPTKALAAQRLEVLRYRYAPLGLNIVQSSRDCREADPLIASGRYHMAVIVAEKLLSLLSQHPQLFSRVGVVVFDELQMIYDEQRGADLELLITRLLREENIQLVGLSAVIDQPRQVAEWLRADLVEESERPVELRQGVLCDGVFHYREFNSHKLGQEKFPDIRGDGEDEMIFEGARYFASRGEMTLIFCASKDESFAWAERISSSLALPPAEEALSELEHLEENLVTESLKRFLSARVAVHNSDLTWPQRRLVEKYASRGEIRVLCSTSTLSEGVNLPIVNTFIPRTVYRHRLDDLSRGRPPRVEQLSRSHFRNMTGRSARYGTEALPKDEHEKPYGRGILVSPFSGDIEPLMKVYIEQEPLAVEQTHLLGHQMQHALLKIVATGSARTVEEAGEFLQNSLSAQIQKSNPTQERQSLEDRTETVANHLAQLGFLQSKKEQLNITPLGLIAARSGVLPETLESFREYVHGVREYQPLEVLLCLALSDDGRLQFVPLRESEWKSRRYLNELYQRLENSGELHSFYWNNLLSGNEASSQPFSAAVKKALVLADWITPLTTVEIERRYRLLCGYIEKLADAFSWLAQCLTEVGFVENWPEDLGKQVPRLSEQLRAGLPPAALGLTPLYERGLNRTALLRLAAAGVHTPQEAEDLPLEEKVALLGRAQAALLSDTTEIDKTIVTPPESVKSPVVVPESCDSRLVLGHWMQLILDREKPDQMTLGGEKIILTPKEFDLLWLLAGQQGKCVSYNRLMEEIWTDTIVEQQQISRHKLNIEKKIRAALGKKAPQLIRTVRSRGLVMEQLE